MSTTLQFERRAVPGPITFYHDPNFDPGYSQAVASDHVDSIDPARPTTSTTTIDGASIPNQLGSSEGLAEDTLTNTLIGTLPHSGSGGTVPGVNHVIVSELASASTSYTERDWGDYDATIIIHSHLTAASIVKTDGLSSYSVSMWQASSTARVSTPKDYHYKIMNDTGSGPTPTTMFAFTIGINLDAPASGFGLKASLHFESSRLFVTLNVNGATNDPQGFKVWDPVTGTVYANDPTFTSGAVSATAAVPATALEHIGYTSTLYGFPNGNFSALETSDAPEFDWIITESISS